MPQLKTTYIDTGKLYFEFRDYPLSYHPGSRVASSFANCAAQQNNFWPLHDRIVTGFADGEWASGNSRDQQLFARYAEELKLDLGQLQACRADQQRFEAELRADMARGEELGIRGTPMFVMNGGVLYGSYSFSTWQQLFESRLRSQTAPPVVTPGPSPRLVFVLLAMGLLVLAVASGVGFLTYRLIKK